MFTSMNISGTLKVYVAMSHFCDSKQVSTKLSVDSTDHYYVDVLCIYCFFHFPVFYFFMS